MSQHALPTLDLRHCFDHASAHKQPVEKRILVVRVNPTVARMILQDDVHTLLFQSVNHFVNKKSAALIGTCPTVGKCILLNSLLPLIKLTNVEQSEMRHRLSSPPIRRIPA